MTDFDLDILSQQPRINRLYTQLTFCFDLADDSPTKLAIRETLEEGFKNLSSSFPWIAGKVVNKNGVFKIKDSGNDVRVVVKDYDNHIEVPQWNTLKGANFPFSMIDESTFAPCKTLEPISNGLSVFAIQLSFVGGGLLLTISGHHGSMDMAGQAQMMHLLAKACRHEPFTSSELSVCNMDRRGMIPLLESHESEEVDKSKSKNSSAPDMKAVQIQNQPPPTTTWAYFDFDAQSLTRLKSLASSSLPSGTSEFVSTDDALSAFIWQSICQSRIPRYGAASSTCKTTLSRNVDVRRYLSIPSSYPGFITSATLHTSELDAVVEQSLGAVAAQLRSALDPASLSLQTRQLATIISRDNTAQQAVTAPRGDPGLDVRLSSWAKEKCYGLDFGFGLPSAVRRPRFTEGSREGLVYLLPKTPNGDIMVGVCLKDEDLERLKCDTEFMLFAKYVG